MYRSLIGAALLCTLAVAAEAAPVFFREGGRFDDESQYRRFQPGDYARFTGTIPVANSGQTSFREIMLVDVWYGEHPTLNVQFGQNFLELVGQDSTFQVSLYDFRTDRNPLTVLGEVPFENGILNHADFPMQSFDVPLEQGKYALIFSGALAGEPLLRIPAGWLSEPYSAFVKVTPIPAAAALLGPLLAAGAWYTRRRKAA